MYDSNPFDDISLAINTFSSNTNSKPANHIPKVLSIPGVSSDKLTLKSKINSSPIFFSVVPDISVLVISAAFIFKGININVNVNINIYYINKRVLH